MDSGDAEGRAVPKRSSELKMWPKTDAYRSPAYGQVCVCPDKSGPHAALPHLALVLLAGQCCDGVCAPLWCCVPTASGNMKTEGSSTELLMFSCG